MRAPGLGGWIALLLLLANTVLAQVLFTHDTSGNLTSALSTSGSTNTVPSLAPKGLKAGDELSLTVKVSGIIPTSYQWQLNGTNISGATNAMYYVTESQATNAGAYSAIVGYSGGSITSLVGNVSILATTENLNGIAYGGGKYVAVGDNGTAVSSSDLVLWTQSATGTTNHLEAVIFDGTRFLAVGNNGAVLTSDNGASWAVQSSGITNQLRSVTYGSGRYVAVGSYGTTLSSTNGTNWYKHTSDFNHFDGVAYGGSLFVAVGENGVIWRSSTGTNWTSAVYETNLTLKAVSYNSAGFFVAAGESGLILKSTDALSWSASNSSNRRQFEAAVLHGGNSILLGPEKKAYISGNGVSWGEIAIDTAEVLNAGTVVNDTIVAAGANGTIIVIPLAVVDHYEFASIPSPQREGQSFSVSVTAKDAAGGTVNTASGSLSLTAEIINQTSDVILGNISPQFSAGAGTTNTMGYAFTPARDLEVTHLRHYFGNSITVWELPARALATLTITNAAGSWIESPMPAPLSLKAGTAYAITVTATNTFYYRTDLTSTFADGTIDQGFYSSGEGFPQVPEYTQAFLLDLRYTVHRAVSSSVSPSSLTLSSGIASGNVTVSTGASSIVLHVTDSSGRTGQSSPILVQASDDLALTMAASAEQVAVSNNVSFVTTVYNAGPGNSTGVFVTNTLPVGTTLAGVSASQGTWVTNAGILTFDVGTLGAQATATISVTVSSTTGSVLVTNLAQVVRSGGETITTNNTASARSYFAPNIYIYDGFAYGLLEGNVGFTTNQVLVLLSSTSSLGVYFDYSTQAGTATPGTDYDEIQGIGYIPPGNSGVILSVRVHGDTQVESDETLFLNIANATNAFVSQPSTSISITNDDGIAGQVYSLAWNSILSPKRAGNPFSATVTAKDYFNSTVTSFTGTVDLTAINVGSDTSKKVLNLTNYTRANDSGLYTFAYDFTPTNTILVTHILTYSGTKVSLWTDTGKPLVSGLVNNTLGEWTTNRISPPLILTASNTYRLGFYSGGEPYFGHIDRPLAFADGKIGGSYYALGDTFPETADSSQIHLVDLLYVRPASMTPSVSGNFSAGVWTGNLTINEVGTNIIVVADDRDGHRGFSSAFAAYATNDMAVNISVSTTAPLVGSNLVYTVVARNPGPNNSTGVFLTNTLPDDVTFVSATVSSGSYSLSGNQIICDFGTVSPLTSGILTLTVTPTVAGVAITNSAVVVRNEADSNTANNQASVILWPSLSVAQDLAEATGSSGPIWSSFGYLLWGSQTNTFYTGESAAQSGAIVHNQFSSLRAVIRGPGVLTFRWKVSCESGGDYLGYYTNNYLHSAISGEVDWQQVSCNVPAGLFTNVWQYTKNGSINAGADAGWVDDIVFTAPEVNLTSVTNSTNGFSFSVVGTNGHRLVVQGTEDFYVWKPVGTNTISGTNFLFTDISSTNYPYRFYRTFHSHSP